MEHGDDDVGVRRYRLGDADLAVIDLPSPGTGLSIPRGLCENEQQLCSSIALGLSNQEIASLRGTSRRTVENQVAALLRKLSVDSRAQLVAVLGRRKP